MKKDEMIRLLALVESGGAFRNDGRGSLFVYENEPLGIWRKLSKEAAFQVIEAHLPDEGLLHSDIVALYEEMRFSRHFAEPKLSKPPDELFVAVENGVLDLATRKLQKKDARLYLRHGLHIAYRDNAALKDALTWDKFMRRSLDLPNGINIADHPKVKRLYASLGLTITPLRGAKKMPILIGASNSGKSVVLRLLELAVGEAKSISMGLQDIYDRFRTDFLGNRHVILVHEVPGKPIKRLDFLKKFIAGEPLISEAKGRQPVEIHEYGRAIMAANCLPVLGEVDQGGAFAARLLANVFTTQEIPEKARDPELLQKLWSERDTIFSLALDAAVELHAHKMQFDTEPEGDALILQYRHESDAVPRFLEDCFEQSSGDVLPLGEAYDSFVQYCRENCLDSGTAMTRTVFRNQMAQLGHLFQKRRVRGFSNPISCVVGLKRRKEAMTLWAQKETVASQQMLEQSEKDE